MLGINCWLNLVILDGFTQAEPLSAYKVLVTEDRMSDMPELGMDQATGDQTRLFNVFFPIYHIVFILL